jgi:2-polyprenyl-3-methyl-5-hydroxy-6-metoxy-1,4-benzoquinol methylase
MPAIAQHLPNLESLNTEKGIILEIYQCSGCGLLQLSNDPVPYYQEVIRSVAFSKEMEQFRIKQFGSFVEQYSLRGKRIIEIGCGGGEYLLVMRSLGVDAHGLEQSQELVQHCIKAGLSVSRGFIKYNDIKLKGAPYDSFFILNFLEHLPHPNTTLRGIYSNVVDGAIGLIEVPNFDMILQKKLFSEFTRDHLLYFTQDTLITTLRLNGFDVIECNKIWYGYILSAIVKKRSRLDIKPFHEHQEKLKFELSEFLAQFEKVAIWGAGHQAFAIISLANLEGKIEYVIDSAIFKQGKFTPATHIPIVSPDALDHQPVQAILVMAAGYSDEVARIIKQKYGSNITVAVLREFGLEMV